MAAYYNEIDPFAAAWLRELIKARLIADGEVDERSIELIRPDDLRGFAQCHFFAGIGGWSYALRLAGWPDDRAVWTGSCPCQPFSSAGRADGADDPRHLWPSWFRLIAERCPCVVFGEQVASIDGLAWLDLVHADMEGAGYAVGAVDLCAASVGAPHIRQRLWFVVDADQQGPQGRQLHAQRARELAAGTTGMADSLWSVCDWLPCLDGKSRSVEPGTFPLAHGVPARVGRLRGYGNAIVPQVAQVFIEAYMSTVNESW